MKSFICWLGRAGFLAASLLVAPARAQTAADFFAGKTISLVIGSGAAGIYDLGGRLMAQFLRKHIPGNPTVVARNMPGASSVVAAEYVFNVAPRDGLTLGMEQPSVVLDKLLDPSAKYRPEQFSWIGRMQPVRLVDPVAATAAEGRGHRPSFATSVGTPFLDPVVRGHDDRRAFRASA